MNSVRDFWKTWDCLCCAFAMSK